MHRVGRSVGTVRVKEATKHPSLSGDCPQVSQTQVRGGVLEHFVGISFGD